MTRYRDTYLVARRELVERIRSKWFVVMTLLVPAILVAMIVVPSLVGGRRVAGAKVEIIDRAGGIAAALASELEQLGVQPTIVAAETPDQTELDRIRDNWINGFVVIPADALATRDPPDQVAAIVAGRSFEPAGKIWYRGDYATSAAFNVALTRAINRAVQGARAAQLGVPPAWVERILSPVVFEAEQNNGVTGATGRTAVIVAYMLAFILYGLITVHGVGVQRSVVEDKTSRVMELMVAMVRPRSLLIGKIVGVGAASLLQISIWLALGGLAVAYHNELLDLVGASGGPALPVFTVSQLVLVAVYFVLGFAFYASMYAATGAMVAAEQDAQQVQMPVAMLMLMGVLCLQLVVGDPRGGAATALTMVPFWSSFLMPMRYFLGGCSLMEVAISLGILLGSTVLVACVAGKIYRVGVLMYGKRPSLRELMRWVRYRDGRQR